MQFLRVTMWESPLKHTTAVVSPDDFIHATVDEFIHATMPPGAFYTKELFECDALETDPRVMVKAMRLFDENIKDERNMAIMFFYDVEMLAHVKSHGVLAASEIAPLTAEQVSAVLEQFARHPRYEHQTRVIPTKDGFIVTMRDGAVTKAPV